MFVTKADGTKHLFNREKILKTCLRLGATKREAEIVAKEVELKVYNGIETWKILKLIFRHLGKYRPATKNQIDLRLALSKVKPRIFERFVQILLREQGYDVIPNQIIRGRCVEHEVDAVATKDGKTCIVEVKHHYNYHRPTGLDVSRISRAVFEDVTEGFGLGLNALKVDGSMIVCNTKLSDHARRYAECKQIQYFGWNSPPNHGLRNMIEEKKLYPITYLKGLKVATKDELESAGIILLKQLVTVNPYKLEKETGILRKTLESNIKKAKTILEQ